MKKEKMRLIQLVAVHFEKNILRLERTTPLSLISLGRIQWDIITQLTLIQGFIRRLRNLYKGRNQAMIYSIWSKLKTWMSIWRQWWMIYLQKYFELIMQVEHFKNNFLKKNWKLTILMKKSNFMRKQTDKLLFFVTIKRLSRRTLKKDLKRRKKSLMRRNRRLMN